MDTFKHTRLIDYSFHENDHYGYKPEETSSPSGTPDKFSLAIAVFAASIANRSAKSVLHVDTVSAKARRCIWSRLDRPGRWVWVSKRDSSRPCYQYITYSTKQA